MMWANLHLLPAGEHMYTVAVTDQPVDVDPKDLCYDEVDVVAPASAPPSGILRHVSLEDREAYAGMRVVGVADQSVGEVVFQDPASELRMEV